MKICVLGAFGNAGRAAMQEILRQTDADVIASDIRPRPPADFFSGYAHRVQTIPVDAARPETLKAALSELPCSRFCIGPFSRYGVAVARAILDNGCHGVDLCNDAVAASGILALDSVARARGLSYITGAGCSPGLTNLLAMQARAARSVWRMRTFRGAACGCANGPVHAGSFHDAGVRRRPGVSRADPYPGQARQRTRAGEFSASYGTMSVSQLGHPEVITLPEHMDVEDVCVKGVLMPSWVERPLRLAAQSGIAREEAPAGNWLKALSACTTFSGVAHERKTWPCGWTLQDGKKVFPCR